MPFLQKSIDAILPPRCVISGEDVDVQGMLAPHIWRDLRFIDAPFCKSCGLPFEYDIDQDLLCAGCIDHPPAFDTARSAIVYDDHSKDLILRFKHADQTHMARAFIPWLKQAAEQMLERTDVIIPVPLHRWRLLKRRYNQAAIMAHALARESGHTCIPDGLMRLRATQSQGHLSPEEREENVKGAFRIHPKYESALRDQSVLLIDDVYTTGATVNACAVALNAAGAARVDVLTLARVIR